MKKMGVIVVLGVLAILVASVLTVGARPDDGFSGGYAPGRGAMIREKHLTDEAVIDCLQSQNGERFTREELKDLRVELAMNGNTGLVNAALVDCSTQRQAVTP